MLPVGLAGPESSRAVHHGAVRAVHCGLWGRGFAGAQLWPEVAPPLQAHALAAMGSLPDGEAQECFRVLRIRGQTLILLV